MCDALSRNTSPAFETIVASCMVHGRRRFIEVVKNFPEECRHVLETLGAGYEHDAACARAADVGGGASATASMRERSADGGAEPCVHEGRCGYSSPSVS